MTHSDELGRVVIPKEIRRTMRIREGDPMEIFTNNEGNVIFKKYSPMGELSEFAEGYAQSLSKGTDLGVIICDRDGCIASSGVLKREVSGRRNSAQLEELMENREEYIEKTSGQSKFFPLEGVEKAASVVLPIISMGDLSGCLCLLCDPTGKIPDKSDIKLARVAVSFLGKQMEE